MGNITRNPTLWILQRQPLSKMGGSMDTYTNSSDSTNGMNHSHRDFNVEYITFKWGEVSLVRVEMGEISNGGYVYASKVDLKKVESRS